MLLCVVGWAVVVVVQDGIFPRILEMILLITVERGLLM